MVFIRSGKAWPRGQLFGGHDDGLLTTDLLCMESRVVRNWDVASFTRTY